MSYTKNSGEVYPLLTTDWLGNPTYKQKPVGRNIRNVNKEQQEFEDDEEVFDIIDQRKKRYVNLVWIDVFLLVLDFLQILALIQSMSLRWVFPEKWLRNTYFIFGFNLDIWEITKFTDNSTYKSVQGHYINSENVDVSFETICYIWFFGSVGLGLIYGSVHFFMKWKLYPLPWARRFMSRLQFCFMTLIHMLSMPFGIVLFRIFQCEGAWNSVDTINEYECWSISHWKLAAPAIVYIILLFLIYPGFLVWKIRLECMSGTSRGYLSFLLLKETEYKIHLNWSWLYDGMWTFSSFKYRGRFYRLMIQTVKLILLLVYATTYNYIKTQSMLTAVFLLLAVLLFVGIRPFRLTSCNAFLGFSLLCSVGNAFIGALLAAYDAYTIPSAWLTPDYIIWFLVFVQGSWALCLVCLLLYLISRTLCHSAKCCYKRPVWPNIATSGYDLLTSETRKYMTAIIKAKIAHEKIIRLPAMFAPVHDLARHIQIINTYCREAEYMKDPLHMVLWEVLDDLVETHAELSPKSIFAETVKKSIRKTAAEFMSMVPMFSYRLAQRDYELILVNPVKKRLLMKMYILGMFLNGRSDRVARRKLAEPPVEKVWPPLPVDAEFEEEDGYYEDLYPGPQPDNFTDNLLTVIVDNSTDAESTEEEDNVQGMLRNLPEVGLIDLETPVIEETEDEEEVEQEDTVSVTTPPPSRKDGVTFGHVTSSDRTTPRPISASSKSSSSSSNRPPSSSSSHRRPASASSSLFSSQASLRHELGSLSPGNDPLWLTPDLGPRERTPSASGRPSSAASQHSSRSAGSRPMSGMSVVSIQPDRPSSASSSLNGFLQPADNPGYIPDEEELVVKGVEYPQGGEYLQGDNPAFQADADNEQDDHDDNVAIDAVSVATTQSSSSNGKKKKKKKRDDKSKTNL